MGAAASAAGAENGGTPTSKLQLYRSLKKELMAINESQSSDPAMQVSGGEQGAFFLLFSGGEPRLELISVGLIPRKCLMERELCLGC